jgi:hypothetical protein
MSLNAILANLDFSTLGGTPFPSGDETIIKEAISIIYNNSPIGQAMLEQSLSNGLLQFRYRPFEGNAAVQRGEYRLL